MKEEQQEIQLKIKRQDAPHTLPYWQEFVLPYRPGHTVISVLMELNERPVTTDEQRVSPPVWEASCLEEVCGSCSMLINGRPRQACATLIDTLEQQDPIFLEPLSKFPVLRDLWVDRSSMFDALRKVQGWIPVDVTTDNGHFGPRLSAQASKELAEQARCFDCGNCMEVCPQFHEHSNFVGPAPLGHVAHFNQLPGGKDSKGERLRLIMDEGGISDCGNAQNCVTYCPKGVTLTKSIAELGRDTTIQWFKDLFWR